MCWPTGQHSWELQGWLGKIASSLEAQNYFPKPRIFKKLRQRWVFLWVVLQISTKICVQRVQISSEIGFYNAKYPNLRPIFAVAQKSIFGKMVTLGPIEYTQSTNNDGWGKLAHLQSHQSLYWTFSHIIPRTRWCFRQSATTLPQLHTCEPLLLERGRFGFHFREIEVCIRETVRWHF